MRLDIIDDILKNKIKLAYAISILFVCYFAYALIIRHDIGKFFNLSGTLQKTMANLAVLRNITEYKTHVDKFNSGFAVSITENRLIDVVRDMAEKTSVELNMLRPARSEIISGYKHLRIEIEGHATYRNLARFVQTLENSDIFLMIESLIADAREVRPSEIKDMIISDEENPGKGKSFYPVRIASFKIIVTCLSIEK